MKRYLAVGPIVVVLLWFVITQSGVIDRRLLPSPQSVLTKLIELFVGGSIFPDLVWTLFRWVAGLGIGIVIGVPLGLLMGLSTKISNSLEAVVDFSRSIPVMAMIPLFMVFFGIGESAKVAIAAWTTILYIVVNTLYGVRHKTEARRMVARVFRASRTQTFFKVVLPEALPHIFVGLRISVSMSLVLVVASEMLMGSSAGLGKRIFDAGMTYNVTDMYATIFIAGILGYISNKFFQFLEHKIVHWGAM